MCVVGISGYGYYTMSRNMLFITMGLGVAVIIISIIGISGASSALSNASDFQHYGRHGKEDILMIYGSLAYVGVLGFLALGIGCILFSDRAMNYLAAEWSDSGIWKEHFGEDSLEEVQGKLFLYMMMAGVLCLLISLLYAISSYAAFKSSSLQTGNYKKFTEIATLVLFLCGMLLIYIYKYSEWYTAFLDSKFHLDSRMPHHLYRLGQAMLVVSVLGFLLAAFHVRPLLKFYTIIACLIVALNAGAAILILRGLPDFQTDLQAHCPEVMPLVYEMDLQEMGCPTKYLTKADSVGDLTCPKVEIREIWEFKIEKEMEEQVTKYGCLNTNCCLAVASNIKARLGYLAIVALIICLAVIVSGVCAWGLSEKPPQDRLEEGEKPVSWTPLVFVFMILFLIAFLTILSRPLPDTPITPPFLKVDPSPNAVTLRDDFYSKSQWVPLYQGEMKVDMNSFDQMEKVDRDALTFYAFITTNDGQFSISKKGMKIKKIDVDEDTLVESDKTKIVLRAHSIEPINKVLHEISIMPYCPLTPTEANIAISTNMEYEDWEEKWSLGYELFGEQTSMQSLFQRKVNLQTIAGIQKYEKIVGQLVYTDTVSGNYRALKGAQVSLNSPKAKHCEFEGAVTDAQGKFTVSLPIYDEHTAYIIQLAFEHVEFKKKATTVRIGGFPVIELLDMGMIQLIMKGYPKKHTKEEGKYIYCLYIYIYIDLNVIGIVKDAITHKEIKKAKVALIEGQIDLFKYFVPEETEELEKFKVETDKKGYFEFIDKLDLDYHVKINKKNYVQFEKSSLYEI